MYCLFYNVFELSLLLTCANIVLMLVLYIVGNNLSYVEIMVIYVNLLDFRQIMGKMLKSGLFMLILCFDRKKWNYAEIMTIYINLLYFRQNFVK